MGNNILAKIAVLISANTAAFNANLKQSQGIFQKFTSVISQAKNVLGAAFGSVAVYQGLKAGIGIMADFEKTMSEVRAITGATGDEFKSLERDALKLGASTKYTASQVGQLQIAYGRLGFTTKEILAATGATLDLAAATGEDLAKSADVAGATVRGFQLHASETQRVVDVMASSFNKSALGLDNFTESMKYVAPVANAAGATVEETTALLATLADAGIRGSMAGTSLRKIFTDMTKDGRPLSERLAELATKGITLQDSFDEVGRTAQTSLLILAKNTEKTQQLSKAFENVSGEAAKMARIMQDNLIGDVEKLDSAWESLLIRLGNTDPIRNATQKLTNLLNWFAGNEDAMPLIENIAKALSNGLGEVPEAVIEEIQAIRREAGKPIDTNIAQELGEKYKLTDDQVNKLYASLVEVNKALSFQEQTMKQFNEFSERNGYKDLSVAVEDYKQRLYELILAEQIQGAELQKYTPELTEEIQKTKDKVSAYRRAINILTEYAGTLKKTSEETIVANEASATTLQTLKDKLDELNKAYDTTAVSDDQRKTRLADEIRLLKDKIRQLELIKAVTSDDAAFFDLSSGAQTSRGNKTGGDFLKAMGRDADWLAQRLQNAIDKLKGLKPPPEVKQAWLEFNGAISSSLATMAEGLGQAIAGVGNFGDTIVKALAGFARQIGEALIAIGVGMLAAKIAIKNPYTAIAAGVALVALSAAMSASMSGAQKNFNSGSLAGGGGGGGGGVNTQATSFTANSNIQDSVPQIVGVVKGQDIWLISERVRIGNGFTKTRG